MTQGDARADDVTGTRSEKLRETHHVVGVEMEARTREARGEAHRV
jgi:hypothetical protein